MSESQVILKLGERVKVIRLVAYTAELTEVRAKFRAEFKYYGGGVIQAWNENVKEWLDCDDDEELQAMLTGNCHENCQVVKLRLVPPAPKALGNLRPESTAVFCCDLQERFAPAIAHFSEIVTVAGRVLKAAELLELPLVVTEQYPKGLLHTVPDLDITRAALVAEKTKFSMLVPEVEEWLEGNPHITSVVLFGVEAHVCVQQTVLDLHARGIEVHVVADATSSRTLVDRHLAYNRFVRLGAFVSTAETVLFQLIADKNHPSFKAVQGLIRELPPDTGLMASVKSNI